MKTIGDLDGKKGTTVKDGGKITNKIKFTGFPIDKAKKRQPKRSKKTQPPLKTLAIASQPEYTSQGRVVKKG